MPIANYQSGPDGPDQGARDDLAPGSQRMLVDSRAELGRQLRVGSPIVAAFVSIIVLAGLLFGVVCRWWVSTPHWDQWDYEGQTLIRYFTHDLSWRFLLSQHNESRLFVPRLVALLYAPVSGWDVRIEIALTLFCALFTAIGVNLLILRNTYLSPIQQTVCIISANAAILCCTQWEVLLFGAYYFIIPGMSIVWALVIAGGLGRYPWKVLAWFALSLLATLSYVNGVMVWFLLLPALFIEGQRAHIPTLYRRSLQAAYCLAGAFILMVYFRTYKHPPQHPSLQPTLARPLRIGYYYFCWLGAPFAHLSPNELVAPIAGMVLLLLFLSASVYLIWIHRMNLSASQFYEWTTIGGYAVLTGLSVSVGRSGFGVGQAFASRYHTFSLLLPAALPPLAFLAISRLFRAHHPGYLRAIAGFCFLEGSATVLFLISTQAGVVDLKGYALSRQEAGLAVEFVDAIPDNPALALAYPTPAILTRVCHVLSPYHLPQITEAGEQIAATARSVTATGSPSNGVLDAVTDYGNGTVGVQGWAELKNEGRPAAAVLVEWQGLDGSVKPIAAVPLGTLRPDVAQVFSNSSLEESGFSDVISKANIPGPGMISAWAIDSTKHVAYQLANTKPVVK